MRRFLFWIDRLFDLFAVVWFVLCHIESVAHWGICLGVYILLHLVSLALCYDTDWCECYAVRTVLVLIISGLLCNIALSVPMIFNEEAPTILPLGMILTSCGVYAVLFIMFYSSSHRFWRLVYDPFQTRWFNIFTDMRMWLMVLDRVFDLAAVFLFIFYHSKSYPHWEVCLYVYITSRLLSIIVCCGTNLCERYIVRVVLLYVAEVFCCAAAWAPGIAEESDGWLVILPVCGLVVFRAFYLFWFIVMFRRSS